MLALSISCNCCSCASNSSAVAWITRRPRPARSIWRGGGTCPPETQERVRRQLVKGIAGFKRLAKFSPYVAGSSFTLADCSAYASLPTVGMAAKAVLGEDLLASAGIDWKAYLKLLGERPSVQRVGADRKAQQEAMAAAAKK